MDGKKRKRAYKKYYKKNYNTARATIKRCPKTEVKYYTFGFFDQVVNDSLSGIDITAQIKQGTGRHERIGNKITVVGLRVRLRYRYNSGYLTKVNAIVRHFLFWSRIELNNVEAGGNWFHTNADNSIALAVVDQPVNKKVAITLKDKLFAVGGLRSLYTKDDENDNYTTKMSNEKNIEFVDYFLKLNRDVYFSGVSNPNPQLILADCAYWDSTTEQASVLRDGIVTLYYIDT